MLAPTNWLQGVTILDLSSLLPSPFAAHLLQKMGARVIKIESPNRPDPARQFGYTPAGGTSSCYRAINDGKELVWLDLKSEADRKRLYDLVAKSDAAIEGYRPEVRARLGIEHATLLAHNPAFVLCSVGGYDPRGPLRSRAGHDVNFVARSGILDQTRDRDGRCVLLGAPLGDWIVGYSAALRLACAIQGARTTRKGIHVEVTIEESLQEAQMPFLREAIESGEPPRAGRTLISGRYPCYRIYELKGGAFALGALEEKFWHAFCAAIGRPELAPAQFAEGPESARIGSQVEQALAQKTFEEWRAIFDRVDCCIEPVLSVKDVIVGL